MGKLFQLPISVKRKTYECMVCFLEINRREGLCASCVKKVKKQGRVICDQCGTTHFLQEYEKVTNIHRAAKSLLSGNHLKGRLIFLGACINCDPEMEIKKVRTQHFKLR
jgi:hypothetical protein